MAYPAQYGAPNGVRNPVVNRDNLTTATTAKPDKNARGADAELVDPAAAPTGSTVLDGGDYEPPADDDWVPPYEEPLAFSADDLALVDEPEGGFEGVDPETGRPALRVLAGEADPSTDTGLERPSANSTAVAVVDVPRGRLNGSQPRTAPGTVERIWDAYVEALRTPAGHWQPTERSGVGKKLSDDRRRVILKALKNETEENLLIAARNWRLIPFLCGQNDRRTVYNDIAVVLRPQWVAESIRAEDGGTPDTGVSDLIKKFMDETGFIDGVGFTGIQRNKGAVLA